MASDTEPLIDAELLALLRCPVTRQRLRLVPDDELASLRARIDETRERESLPPMEGALIREDGTVFYAIREGIPWLLADQGIALGDEPPGIAKTPSSSQE